MTDSRTAPGSTPRWSMVILRGDGRPAWTLALPTGVVRVAQACLPLLFGLGIWAGWLLHGQLGVQGPLAQNHQAGAPAGYWGYFTGTGDPIPTERVREMQRQAAISHAAHLGLGSVRAAGKLLAGMVAQRWIDAANRGPRDDGSLLWPVPTGWYVRGFGSGTGGYHLAVDIMGRRGTDVLAAAPGIVGYAGSSVRGYGNMIALIHPGGKVSVYAHNQAHYVVPGQRVARGEPIAALGNTGISRGPHVHFELIHGGKNCDPLRMFRPGVRHRAGHLGEIAPLSWAPDAARPRDLRCARRRRHPNSRWHHGHGHGEEAAREPPVELRPPPPAHPPGPGEGATLAARPTTTTPGPGGQAPAPAQGSDQGLAKPVVELRPPPPAEPTLAAR